MGTVDIYYGAASPPAARYRAVSTLPRLIFTLTFALCPVPMELHHPLMHDGSAHAQDEDAGYASESTVHVFHDEADEPSAEDTDADTWGFEWVSPNCLHASNPNLRPCAFRVQDLDMSFVRIHNPGAPASPLSIEKRVHLPRSYK